MLFHKGIAAAIESVAAQLRRDPADYLGDLVITPPRTEPIGSIVGAKIPDLTIEFGQHAHGGEHADKLREVLSDYLGRLVRETTLVDGSSVDIRRIDAIAASKSFNGSSDLDAEPHLMSMRAFASSLERRGGCPDDRTFREFVDATFKGPRSSSLIFHAYGLKEVGESGELRPMLEWSNSDGSHRAALAIDYAQRNSIAERVTLPVTVRAIDPAAAATMNSIAHLIAFPRQIQHEITAAFDMAGAKDWSFLPAPKALASIGDGLVLLAMPKTKAYQRTVEALIEAGALDFGGELREIAQLQRMPEADEFKPEGPRGARGRPGC